MSDQYAVFGHPIKHSRSPFIHNHFAAQTAQALTYTKELIAKDNFEQRVRDFFAAGGCGLNITLPFKQRAFALCEQLSPRAEAAQAVNTLYLNAAGQLCGDNTDGIGLVRDMQAFLQWQLKGQRVLLIGAGGAARGVILPLIEAQIGELVIANRTRNKAQDLVHFFQKWIREQSFDRTHISMRASGLNELEQQGAFDIIINASSASLSGVDLGLPAALITSTTACYDMAYAAEPTLFIRWALNQGVERCADGYGMLLEQAAEAFYLWRGVRPATDTLRDMGS